MTTKCKIYIDEVPWLDEDIVSARVIEQINPLSVEVISNSIEFTLHSDAGGFSAVDPDGILASFQYRQLVEVYEEIDGDEEYIGAFYLTTWESLSEFEAHFTAVDAIGIMDNTYLSNEYGLWVDAGAGVSAYDLISDICTVANVPYGILASVPNTTLYGYVPMTSCREALQNVLFRIGAYASCAGTDIILIYPMVMPEDVSIPDHLITSVHKGIGKSLSLRPIVTGVKLISHNYASNIGGEIQSRWDGTLDVGEHLIVFDVPRQAGSWTGTATLDPLYSGVHWELVDVTSPGTAIFESEGFIDSKLTFTVQNPSALGMVNVLEINDATMVNSSNAQAVTQRVYDYYSQRYLQRVRLYGKRYVVGDTVMVQTQGKWIVGVIEKVEVDLVGGCVSNVEVVGSLYECDNVLTANLTILTAEVVTYVGCLDMLDYNMDIQGTGQLIIS